MDSEIVKILTDDPMIRSSYSPLEITTKEVKEFVRLVNRLRLSDNFSHNIE